MFISAVLFTFIAAYVYFVEETPIKLGSSRSSEAAPTSGRPSQRDLQGPQHGRLKTMTRCDGFLAAFQSAIVFDMRSFKYNRLMRNMIDNNHIT